MVMKPAPVTYTEVQTQTKYLTTVPQFFHLEVGIALGLL